MLTFTSEHDELNMLNATSETMIKVNNAEQCSQATDAIAHSSRRNNQGSNNNCAAPEHD